MTNNNSMKKKKFKFKSTFSWFRNLSKGPDRRGKNASLPSPVKG